MKIATWNVNSLRARADRVEEWLERSDVDVLAIQETKCTDANFPSEIFEFMGYEVAHFGLSQWNGVAIASRVGLEDVQRGFENQPVFGKPGEDEVLEARAIGATCGGVRVWSLYIPNGRGLTDPHMDYKLRWLDALRANAADWLKQDASAEFALVGDWNELTHISAPERAAFNAFLDEVGLVDPVRERTPGEYTYWDYQAGRFPKNEGMRIDFQLLSPALASRVTGASIDRDEREGAGASDHTPVVVELG